MYKDLSLHATGVGTTFSSSCINGTHTFTPNTICRLSRDRTKKGLETALLLFFFLHLLYEDAETRLNSTLHSLVVWKMLTERMSVKKNVKTTVSKVADRIRVICWIFSYVSKQRSQSCEKNILTPCNGFNNREGGCIADCKPESRHRKSDRLSSWPGIHHH